MTNAPPWTGFLCRDGDGVRGTLVDAFGFITEITGVPEVRDNVRGYAICARLLSVPAEFAFPWDKETNGIAST